MTVTLYCLRVFSIDGSDMVCNKTGPVARAKVDRVAIIRSLAVAAWESISKLPEHVPSHAGARERSGLPAALHSCTFIGVAN
jgi:hypothetical protein